MTKFSTQAEMNQIFKELFDQGMIEIGDADGRIMVTFNEGQFEQVCKMFRIDPSLNLDEATKVP